MRKTEAEATFIRKKANVLRQFLIKGERMGSQNVKAIEALQAMRSTLLKFKSEATAHCMLCRLRAGV